MHDNDSEGIPLRRILIWSGVALGVIGLLLAGAWVAWPRYRAWTSARALQEARESHLAGEYRRQQLFLEQAVQMDGENLEARRQLAEFYSQSGQPQALDQWATLIELQPGLLANHRGLVLTLLRRGEAVRATQALAAVPQALQADPEFLRLTAAVAMAAGDLRTLEATLGRLATQDAAPEVLRLSRAALQLNSKDAAERQSARTELATFARRDEYRIRATLVLLRTLPSPRDAAAATELAELILGAPRKSSLLPSVRPGLSSLLHHMMSQPAPQAADAAALMQWMQGQGLAREALVWVSTQPAPVRGSAEVLGARAACAMQARQWGELRETVTQGVWGAIPEDTVTLVFAARIQRDAGSAANARATWADALAQVERRPEALRVLHRLADGWGWLPEADRCLRLLVRFFPREDAYWGALLHQAQLEGNSDRAMEVLSEWCRVQDDPPRIRTEQLLLGALLGRLDSERAQKLAQLGREESADAVLRIAAALQASRSGQTSPALPPASQAAALSPRARLARAVVLSQGGQAAEAREAVAGLGQVAFLPEERVLLTRIQELRPALEKN